MTARARQQSKLDSSDVGETPAEWAARTLWTEDMVKLRLKEAADCLRRMKATKHTWPAGYFSGWPEIVRDTWEAYGYDPGRRPLVRPSGKAIDEMDEVFRWIEHIGAESEIRRLVERHHHRRADAERAVIDRRKIAWSRACRIPWRKLEDMDGRSHTTLRKIQREALEAILRQLNAKAVGSVWG